MINFVSMTGRLTRDPEIKSTSSGTECVNFALAVQRDYKPKDGGERETDFFECTCYGRTAPFIASNFRKGKWISILGSLRQRKYTDREGKNHQTVVIMVERAEFVPTEKREERSDYEEFDAGFGLPF